jgi:hypothetical protein
MSYSTTVKAFERRLTFVYSVGNERGGESVIEQFNPFLTI